jgi:hypothetical protein
MKFLNNTSLDDIIDNEVTVMLSTLPGQSEADVAEFCLVFFKDGTLHIDFSRLHRGRFVSPLPEESIVSRNEEELSMGRYLVVIPRYSPAGTLLSQLLSQ